MKYVIVEDLIVKTVIVSDANPEQEWVLVPDETPVEMGWTDNEDGTFSAPALPPEEQPPRILTHLEFRRRFTPAEQELADELEVTFETNPMFTVEQKRGLRTGYKNFYAASEVHMDDPAIPPMLYLYVAIGILEPHRPAEILS